MLRIFNNILSFLRLTCDVVMMFMMTIMRMWCKLPKIIPNKTRLHCRGISRNFEADDRFYFLLAVPGHALLWLSLVKWKRKKRESARF
jgi:hypothetical protein